MEKELLRIKRWVKRHLPWIYFVIALILLLFPNTKYSPFAENWNSLIEKIGFVALTSGVFAGILKSIQFSGLFKEELGKVISGSDFLKNRKDLPALWRKVSKAVYNEKFPEISDLLDDRILDTYLPVGKSHYNEDFVITVDIHELTDDLVLHYTQTVEYFAVLNSEDQQSIIGYTETMSDAKSVNEKNELLSFRVNGKEFAGEDIRKKIEENDKIRFRYEIPITGVKKSKVCLKVKNTYSLKGENYKLIRFSTITHNVDVIVSYNKDIDVSFFNIGLVKDFEPIHVDVKNTLSRRHRNDIILPKQGFGLSFNKK